MRTIHQIRMSKLILILLVKGYKSAIFLITFTQSVILEGELSSAEMQADVGNNYGNLQFAFNNFQSIMKKTCQQQNVFANDNLI